MYMFFSTAKVERIQGMSNEHVNTETKFSNSFINVQVIRAF